MGLHIGMSSCSCTPPTPTPQQVQPDPRRFTIQRASVEGRFLVAEVVYPDAKNYEGRKILVYEGLTAKALGKASVLDPHFCEHSTHPSPIARFEPTPKGWRYALAFCRGAA